MVSDSRALKNWDYLAPSVLDISYLSWICNRDVGDGWAGWAIAYPGFGRSVNPISTRKGKLCPFRRIIYRKHTLYNSFFQWFWDFIVPCCLKYSSTTILAFSFGWIRIRWFLKSNLELFLKEHKWQSYTWLSGCFVVFSMCFLRLSIELQLKEHFLQKYWLFLPLPLSWAPARCLSRCWREKVV